MTPIAVLFLLTNAILVLVLPRRWAPLPLLIGTCYMTSGQMAMVGPFHFTVVRILIGVAFIRVILRGERLSTGMNALDWIMIAWCCWALGAGLFKADIRASMVFRLGLVYNYGGIYFLIRIFCQSLDDVVELTRFTAILLVPLGLMMLIEKVLVYNPFSIFGGVPAFSVIRDGRVRAQGPFAISILAGTIGAVSLPAAVGLWRYYRTTAILGSLACVGIVIACASSGPVLSMLAAIAALLFWHWREYARHLRWIAVIGYVFLSFVMKSPPYYLIARMDVVSGSTGWHRAALIDAGIRHIREWWLIGTDYTRHWMPSGVTWSPEHTDITNHYLHIGVIGGLPLTVMFIASIAMAFSYIGRILRMEFIHDMELGFVLWALGSMLFAHAVTSISIAYFDQSYIFLYLSLAIISSAWSECRDLSRQVEISNQQFVMQELSESY